MSVVLRVAYDGSGFHGFARQNARPDGRPLPTIQGALEDALAVLYGRRVVVRGASRTDAGVHASGQLAAFEPPFDIPMKGVVLGLAGRLPRAIIVTSAWVEHRPDGRPLDPRRRNGGKRYRYVIRCSPLRDPRTRAFEWHQPRDFDLEAMRLAAARMVGEHDFSAFRAAACQSPTTVRTISSIVIRGEAEEVSPFGDPRIIRPCVLERVITDVEGHAFLHNMVRIMVGSLVEVGDGRRPPEWISELLAAGDRTLSGITAPAQGLTLVEVRWTQKNARVDRAALRDLVDDVRSRT